jgi:hypothetical protein
VNSTNSLDVSLEKELVYLPSTVENSVYSLEIVPSINGSTPYVHAFLINDASVEVHSWLLPGLNVVEDYNMVESSERIVVVGCSRNEAGVYVEIKYG